jgi:osmoprotectant transport system ATP-binding protein
MHEGRLVALGTAKELSRINHPYVSELLGTPRRQAERLQAALSQSITL